MNNSTYDLRMISLANLLNHRPTDILYMFVGNMTIFFNVLIIITIAKTKRLHTRCYFLIANVSVAAIIYSVSFVITAVKRFIRYDLKISEIHSQVGCDAEMLVCYFGQSACASLPLATAAERFMATLAPMKYKNTGKGFVIILTFSGWGYALVDSGFTFYGSSFKDIVLNCNIVSTTDQRYVIQSSCDIAITLLVVIVYVCVWVVIHHQNKKARTTSASSNITLIKAKIELKVAKSLSVTSGVQLLTQVSTRVGLALLPLLPEADKWISASYMRIIILIGLSATFFVYLIFNMEFGRSFSQLFHSLPVLRNKVHPIGVEMRLHSLVN